MKTFMPKAADIKRDWLLVDAKGKVLGRLATQIATLLRGKHKTTFAPHADTGDFVIVINAGEIVLTGAKHTDKTHHWYTGYPGGLKTVTYGDLLKNDPAKMLTLAVKRMLPNTHSRHNILTRLKIYSGNEHPHTAQQPKEHKLLHKS